MSVDPHKARLYMSVFLSTLTTRKISFEKAFRTLVRKYNIKTWEAEQLYKLAYKIVIYYYSIEFLARLKGYKNTPSHLTEFLYQMKFDVNRVLEELGGELRGLSPSTRISLMHGYPPWIVRDLYGKLPLDELEKMLSSLNVRKRWLVVNTAKTSVEKAVECLENHGVEVIRHPDIEELLMTRDPFKKVAHVPCIKRAEVLPQDISSYIITKLLEEFTGDFVDACSAPGLKLVRTLLTGNYGRAIAVDISEKRMSIVPKVVEKAVGRVPTLIVVNGDSRTLIFNVKSSLVLIDAPCSNSGAIYANPVVKLYLTRKLTWKMSKIQLSLILNSLKYGERVLYVACSIHPLEGEEVSLKVIGKAKNARLAKISVKYGSQGYSGYEHSKLVQRLYPHVVNGQGFFVAMFERG